jgi:hypothetical protein
MDASSLKLIWTFAFFRARFLTNPQSGVRRVDISWEPEPFFSGMRTPVNDRKGDTAMSQHRPDVAPRPVNGQSLSSRLVHDRLAALQWACQELAHTESLEEIKEICDTAEAVRQYACNARAELELRNMAAEFKLRSERRAGELLRSMSLRGGDRKSETCSSRTTLDQIGINQNQSTRWQKLATVPEEEFCRLVRLAHEGRTELTSAALLRLATARKRKDNCAVDSPASTTNDTCCALVNTSNSSEDVIAELLNHWQVLDDILGPFYDGGDPGSLHAGQGGHLRRLVRESTTLLVELQQILLQ